MSIKQQFLEVDHNGQAIRGMIYRPDSDGIEHRVPAVLMLHGFTGQRMENGFFFVRLARELAEQGVAAVTFDFLNSGESDGSFDRMLVTEELADAMRMTDWLTRQPFVDRTRLGLLGFSLGGLLASCVSARTDVYKALALIAPTTEQNVQRHAKRECDDDACSTVLGPHCLHPGFFDDVATLDPVGDCLIHSRPTLLVHGTEDTAVPSAVAEAFVDAMRGAGIPLEVQRVEGADHVFNRRPHREAVLAKVASWLAEGLTRGSVGRL